MAKEVIVLKQTSNGTSIDYTGLFWFAITSNPVTQTAGSQWVADGTNTAGPSTAENQAIQAGTVKEENWSFSFPVGLAASAIQAFLQQAWVNRNAEINGIGAAQYEGEYYDSSTGWNHQ